MEAIGNSNARVMGNEKIRRLKGGALSKIGNTDEIRAIGRCISNWPKSRT